VSQFAPVPVPALTPPPWFAESIDQNVTRLPPSSFFTDKGHLVTPRLAAVIRSSGHTEMGSDGRLYRYDHGVYRPDGDSWVRAQVREQLDERWTKRHSEEVTAWLRTFDPTITATPPTKELNCPNGLLDWETGVLRPHTPDVLSTIRLGAAWHPDATCPRIDRFLGEVLPSDAVELAMEVVGITVFSGKHLRRAVMLEGPGCGGKSVLLNTVKRLAGPANVSAIPLQVLAENRFAAAELFGKVANICGDLDARAIRTTDMFKMATGGDDLMAERKHGQPFTFVPFANFLFAANEPPITSDQSDGWFDRWLVIPMDRRIPDNKVDPKLLEKLTTPAELSGLLVHAVSGLQRVMQRGRLAEVTSTTDAAVAYRDRLDTVRGFVGEGCVLHAEAWTPRPQLYKRYQKWAKEGGRFAVSAATFNDHLRRNYPAQVHETTRRGSRGWQGIGVLTDHYSEEDD
jgi:P4 family phage/plasmid primase-like protien